MANFQRRASGIYVARLAVPARLQPVLGRREFIESTGTRNWAMAKLLGAALVARWREQFFALDRLALGCSPMDHESTIKIADGHPLLRSGGHLPLSQAAAASGIGVADLLRQAADGRLDLFVRMTTARGYLAPFWAFDDDDPELGTRIIPTFDNMPREAQKHVASGVFKVPADDLKAVASHLLVEGNVEVVVLELLEDSSQRLAFVPEQTCWINTDNAEVLAAAVEDVRTRLTATVTPDALASARREAQSTRPSAAAASKKGATLLSSAVDTFVQDVLPQSITSGAEMQRMRTALMLLPEFVGDLPVGKIDADLLRHFRNHHLARIPARENLVRAKYKTNSVTESIAAVAGTDWPMMSANERDLRMAWLARFFGWLHREKWIGDDPTTGLKKESVLTKKQKDLAELNRKDREEFTDDELKRIFSEPWFVKGAGELTLEGTYREFQPFHYWLPLLGAFTGARIAELTQLHLSDVGRTEAGTWFIDINQKTPDKSLKNKASVRRIPLHSKLVQLGFPDWCDRLRQAGYQRVFPELSWDPTKRYMKDPTRVMSQLFGRLGMPRDGTKVFHSFRHGMNNNLMKRTNMPDIMRKRLMGHEPGSDVNTQTYLSDPTPDEMAQFVESLMLPLPEVGGFDVEAGIAAVRDALRRKKGRHGASESLGAMALQTPPGGATRPSQ